MKNNLIFYGNPIYKGLEIKYQMTTQCNFNCSYCSDHNSEHKFQDYSIYLKFIEFVNNIDKDIPIEIQLLGGEIIIIPEIKQFILDLSKMLQYRKNTTIRFLSNLSKGVSFFKSISEIFDKHNIEYRFYFSYHKDFISQDLFFQRCDEIFKFDKAMKVAYMIETEACSEEYKKYEHKEYTIDFRPLDSIIRKPLYKKGLETNSQCGIYLDGTIKYTEDINTNFCNYVCMCYSKNMRISQYGDISPCTTILNSKYNINDYNYSDIIKKQKFILCPEIDCRCELKIPKFNLKNIELMKDKEKCQNIFGFIPGWF